MSAQHHLAAGDQLDRDRYAREQVLNSTIIGADISKGWEEYLENFYAFYADDVEVTAGTETAPIRGKERIRALLLYFLAPLHLMVEIGGLAIDIRESPIHGDAADETHSAWENGYIRNWTPSSSRNLTDPSRFQPQPRLPSVGMAFTLSSSRDSRPSALTSG